MSSSVFGRCGHRPDCPTGGCPPGRARTPRLLHSAPPVSLWLSCRCCSGDRRSPDDPLELTSLKLVLESTWLNRHQGVDYSLPDRKIASTVDISHTAQVHASLRHLPRHGCGRGRTPATDSPSDAPAAVHSPLRCTSCPPNWPRSAATICMLGLVSCRDENRANSEAANTGIGTARATASSSVQRPSPESVV